MPADLLGMVPAHGANRVMFLAAEQNSVAVLEYLFRHGADVHATDDYALRVACERSHLAAIGCILAHGANVGALRTAAGFGRLNTVECLRKHEANIHGAPNMALVKFLLEHEAAGFAEGDRAQRWGRLRAQAARHRAVATLLEPLFREAADDGRALCSKL